MCVCASIRPGVTHWCERSMTWAPAGMARPAPIDLILPFSTRMTWSLALAPCAGSMTAPARIATTCAESGAASNSASKANKFFIGGDSRSGTGFVRVQPGNLSLRAFVLVVPHAVIPDCLDSHHPTRGGGMDCLDSHHPQTSGRGRTGKDFFRQQRVYADVAVDELRDVDVHRDAREHVGFIAAQMLFLHEEFDHV